MPAIEATVAALKDIPAQLDQSIEAAAEARDGISEQTFLWRLAVVAAAIAALGGLWAVSELAKRQVDASEAELPEPQP
jgi:type VI protein secretion system component VasF